MKKLAIRLVVAVLTLSAGIGFGIYVKHRAQAKRCAESTYFPVGVFGDNPRRTEWFSKYLATQNEPTFSCLGEDVEVYRLLYLPAFDSPTSIRVWRQQGQYWMTIKQLDADWTPFVDGDGGLKFSTTRPLTDDEWEQFKNRLIRTNFWSMPSPDVKEPGLDGYSITLEGKNEGRYHVVYRWMPDDENFIDASSYLLEISNLTWRQQREF